MSLKNKKRRPHATTQADIQDEVSQKCDTLPWAFKVYVSPMGACDVDKRIGKLTDEALEEFRSRVRYLANTPKLDWCRPEAAKLKGYDIYEIRFKANGLQHRPFGFFGPNKNEFTVVLWTSKKGSVTDPGDAVDTASTRCKEFKNGATTRDLKIDGEVFPPPKQKSVGEEGVRESRANQWLGSSNTSIEEKSWLDAIGVGEKIDNDSGGNFSD